MRDSVATASRDLLAIKRRKFTHYAYRGLQLALRRGRSLDDVSSVCLLPAFDDESDLGDVLNRMGWYFPAGTLPDDASFTLATEDLDLTEDFDPTEATGPTDALESTEDFDPTDALEHVPDAQRATDVDHLPIHHCSPETLGTAAASADAVLCWDASARLSLAGLRNITRVEIVDPTYWSGHEPYTWGVFSDAVRTETADDSAAVFRDLEEQAATCERSYVFATGPSLEDAFEMEFEDDSLTVVCNSIVKNDDLLAHIDPDVLVFADPVFHFGPSEYAARFRADAVDAHRTYDCTCVVPEQYGSLLRGHYPDLDLVEMRSEKGIDPHFPTHDDRRVMHTENIMTLLMLPIAFGLTDEVNVLGADGREESESYFWEHSDAAQYDDEVMKTAVDTHPAFFRDRVYTDYYEEHVDTLTAMIEDAESRGITVRNLTHSYIDALARRRVDPSE